MSKTSERKFREIPEKTQFGKNEYAAKKYHERENDQFNRNQAYSYIRTTT